MKVKRIIKDLASAIEQLSLVLDEPAETDLMRAGCIQYFEFSFELAWKSIKIIVSEQGLIECTSPKTCIKQAFNQGWIENEQIWLEMLTARNLMSHTYHASEALKVYHSLNGYLGELRNLLNRLEKLCSD